MGKTTEMVEVTTKMLKMHIISGNNITLFYERAVDEGALD